MNDGLKFFLQSIGRYNENLTMKEANEIVHGFSKDLVGFDVRSGFYHNLAGSHKTQELKPSIQYKKMSLFDAPKVSILVHACNAQGVWGSGIAKEFKSKFPKAFEEYNNYCKNNLEYHTLGTVLITALENNYKIGCLINSSDYGIRLSPEKLILDNTKHSLEKLVGISNIFYSNKFNSGFFKVPWEKTEKLIQDFVNQNNVTWIICDPNLETDKK